MNSAYLLLGSNMHNPKVQLENAEKEIEKYIGQVIHASSFYRTAAWGEKDQPDFINRVLEITTTLSAENLLNAILRTEEKMGRVRTLKNAPRIIDIDILFFNEEIINKPHLTVPHPELQQRRFVLVPMAEIAGEFVHPVLHQPIRVLLNSCRDVLNVQKI